MHIRLRPLALIAVLLAAALLPFSTSIPTHATGGDASDLLQMLPTIQQRPESTSNGAIPVYAENVTTFTVNIHPAYAGDPFLVMVEYTGSMEPAVTDTNHDLFTLAYIRQIGYSTNGYFCRNDPTWMERGMLRPVLCHPKMASIRLPSMKAWYRVRGRSL